MKSANWRVNFTRHLPAILPTGIHREIIVDLFTDFGETVLDSTEPEEHILLDLAIYALDERNFRFNFDDLHSSSNLIQETGHINDSFEAYRDSSCEEASRISFKDIKLSRNKNWRLWIRNQSADSKSKRNLPEKYRIHASCRYHDSSPHPGGGNILS